MGMGMTEKPKINLTDPPFRLWPEKPIFKYLEIRSCWNCKLFIFAKCEVQFPPPNNNLELVYDCSRWERK